MRILKFGGSSVGTPERISDVIDILKNYLNNNIEICVVFSAFQSVTDKLISLSRQTVERNESYKKELEQLKQIHINAIDFLLKEKNEKISVGKKVIKLLVELEEILHGVYLVKELTPRTLDYIMSFGERLSCTIISEVMNCKGIEAEPHFKSTRRILLSTQQAGQA